MKRVFITGAAGFIGSNLVDKLLASGLQVVGWDNLSTGDRSFLQWASKSQNFCLLEGDNLDLPGLTQAMQGCDTVVHLAANADVRFGTQHPSRDLQQNTVATFNVLEAMRCNGIRDLAFSSTGSVYGECEVIPTPEDAPFPVQTSLYGASKVACEGLIAAYCEGYGLRAAIFRFVSILGERYTHGHVFDFYRQLLQHPERLDVLGDGKQRKSYLHVGDCVAAIEHILDRLPTSERWLQIYNLGTREYCQVVDSIGWICEHLALRPELKFSGGKRGWIGDNPFIFLDTSKIEKTGWKPASSIHDGIIKTVDWLRQNEWVLEKR